MTRLAKILAILLSCLPCAGWAAIKLAPPFSDNMVLQRGMPVPVWGTAEPGEGVTVKFRSQEKTTQADAQGKWSIALDSVEVGDPATLEATGSNTLTLANVLVGEVWIGSGQSNMENSVVLHAAKDPALAEAAKGTYPHLRLLIVKDGVVGTWQEATPRTIAHFSALLFSFGLDLNQELHVPIGLIVAAQGGTSSAQWISPEAYNNNAACQAALQKSLATKAKAMPSPDSSPPQKPGDLRQNIRLGEHFQADILPLIPFAFRGLLWDQGENGTGIFGVDQYSLMSALIADWRATWKRGEFPFIFVQKPSGGGSSWLAADQQGTPLPQKPPKLKSGLEREMYTRLLRLPHTAMVITSDLGEGTHPEDKSDYGRRAANTVLGAIYGQSREIYGPIYRSKAIEGSKIRLSFDHVGRGLAVGPGDKLQGFSIAGSDRKFRWADAVIDGNTVIVSSEKVAVPVAVRYAWSDTPAWANLFNREGLPALSFRTDDWTE